VTTNPYHFRHYDLSSFALNVNGKQIPTEGTSLGMDHEKKSVMGYRSLFEGSDIHHSNSGLHIIRDIYINGYLMLIFDLTHDRSASEGHTPHPDNGNIRVELKFSKPLPKPIMCIFYLEYANSVRVDTSRTLTTDFLKTNKNGHNTDIVYVEGREIVLVSLPLRHVASLRHAIQHGLNQRRSSHGENFTPLAVRFLPKSSSVYFFDMRIHVWQRAERW